MLRRTLSVLVSSALCAWSSCATTGAGDFPTAEELEALSARPLPKQRVADEVVRVSDWTLQGPLAVVVQSLPFTERTIWTAPIHELSASRAGLVLVSRPLMCAAREIGLFRLKRKGAPPRRLSDFILARCGATVPSLMTSHVFGAVSDDETDEEVVSRWLETHRSRFGKHSRGGPRSIGTWFGRDGGQAVWVTVSGERRARIEPVKVVPDGDRVELRGEVLRPAASMTALINA